MPTVQCPSCGKVVRFEGIAGVCPNCAAVVRAPKPKEPQAAPARSLPPAKASRPGKSGANPADLDSIEPEGEEVFAPSSEPVHHNPLAGLDKRLVYGLGGAIAVVFLFGLYIMLRTPTPNVAIVSPTPTPPRRVSITPPSDDNTDNVAPVPVQPTVVPQPTTVPIVVPAVSKPAWMGLKPVTPKLAAKPITDQMVEDSIKKAVAYSKTQFSGNELLNPSSADEYCGTDALVVYSLLHAGEAINDSDLSITNPFMQGLLNQLKQYKMSGDKATYCRALRASALAMTNRDADAAQLARDRAWLLESEVNGAYDYTMPEKGATSYHWDNSNSQYGVLGIWATVQAGIAAPDKFWNDVENHWLSCQDTDGSWSYQDKDNGALLTMTCAGVTTLCVTAEQLELISSKGKHDAHPKMSQAIERGIDWMGKEDRLMQPNQLWSGYSLYGVERAALATGYRWFGNHDWYRDLGARELQQQQPNGSWGSPLETAFRVLFLSRGRQPIFINKLRFDGDWNDRPRDAAKITQFASEKLEKPFAWGVADLSRNWWDWMESPFLFITTDAAPNFSDEDCKKLRSYTDAGGMIFIHNEFATKEVDSFVNDLAKRAYPEYPMVPMAPDDLLYSTVFPMKVKPPLKSIGNGTRTFVVYSPADITEGWVRYKAKDSSQDAGRQLALNLFVGTAGKSNFRNRLDSPYEEPPDFDAIGTLPIFRISYAGAWNPEPKAYERFPRWFQKQTSVKLDIQTVGMADLSTNAGPVALLTGNSAVDFSKMDLRGLNDYVTNGGVLVIDSTGGNKAFAQSVRTSLLPGAFPGLETSDIPLNHPVLAGGKECMDSLPKPKLRNYASMILNGTPASIQYATVGKGTVIVSDLDLTTGLLNSGTYGIFGYAPAYSQSFLKNVILWAQSRYGGI